MFEDIFTFIKRAVQRARSAGAPAVLAPQRPRLAGRRGYGDGDIKLPGSAADSDRPAKQEYR